MLTNSSGNTLMEPELPRSNSRPDDVHRQAAIRELVEDISRLRTILETGRPRPLEKKSIKCLKRVAGKPASWRASTAPRLDGRSPPYEYYRNKQTEQDTTV